MAFGNLIIQKGSIGSVKQISGPPVPCCTTKGGFEIRLFLATSYQTACQLMLIDFVGCHSITARSVSGAAFSD